MKPTLLLLAGVPGEEGERAARLFTPDTLLLFALPLFLRISSHFLPSTGWGPE